MPVSQATVFGGSGFIGRYLVKRLAGSGVRVVAAVRHPGRAGFLKPMGDVGQVVPVRAELGDRSAVAAAVEGSDLVVNLAGILVESGRQRFQAVHERGAGHIAGVAAAAGASRLIHVSAIGADSESPSAYGRSKAGGEAAVRAAFPEADIVRPSVVFGAEDDFFNRFAALARIAPALPLVDRGRTRFQPVYVADVADGLSRIAGRRKTGGGTWEFGGPHIYTFRELLEFVLATTGRRAFLIPVPEALLSFQARILELLPAPPLTRDQIAMLRRDNVVSDRTDIGRLADLGIEPTPLEGVVPAYLMRYRRGGGVRPGRPGRSGRR